MTTEISMHCYECGHEWVTERSVLIYHDCPKCGAENSEPGGEARYRKAKRERTTINRVKNAPLATTERVIAAEKVCMRLGVVVLSPLPEPDAKALRRLWNEWSILVEEENECLALITGEDT